MRERIKQIVFEEFSKVVTNIENDFRSNYTSKSFSGDCSEFLPPKTRLFAS